MSKFDDIRKKYKTETPEGYKPPKTYSQLESARIGGEAGLGWGFRDEAEGTAEVRKQAIKGMGVPEPIRQLTEFSRKLNPAASGASDALLGLLIENTKPEDSAIGQTYRGARDERRNIENIARQDNPVSYTGSEVLAGIASGPPLTGVARGAGVGAKAAKSSVKGTIGRYTAEGAGYGATFGAGHADEGSRLEGATMGGAIGGAGGAILGPAAQYVLAPIAKGIGYKAFTSAENKALDMVLRRADRSGTDLSKVRDDFAAWNKTGEVPETLAELMGPNERGLLSALVTANSGTRSRAGEVLLERGKGEVDRLEDAFARSMGAKRGGFGQAKADAQRARAEDPEAFYQAAHFEQGGQRRFLDPEQTNQLAYEIGGSRVASGTLSDAANYADALGERAVRDEIDDFAKALSGGKGTKPLSVQAADYIERVINRKYGAAAKGTIQDVPGGIRALRDRIRAVIDPSGLGEARATSAERIRRGELLDEGRQFLKPSKDVEDINNVLRGNKDLDIAPASAEGQKNFTIGAARAISDQLRNTADMKGFADATRKIARTPAIREKVAAVRPQVLTKKGVPHKGAKQTRLNQELDQAIERTADRADFTNEMLGNSRTAFRQADMADAAFDDTLAQGIGDATSELLINGPAAAQAGLWRKFGQGVGNYVARPGVMNPKINQAAADILLASGEKIPDALAKLIARQSRGPIKRTPTPPTKGGGGGKPVAAGGFAGFGERRPVGFHDEIPRGSDPFSDPRLTPTENKAVEMAKNGYSNAEIAEELMLSEANGASVVLAKARSKGVDVPVAEIGRPPETRDRILELAQRGARPSAIAEMTGKSVNTVKVTLSKARKALRDAGEELPDWLKPRTDLSGTRFSGLQAAQNDLGNAAVGGAIGGVHPDFDGDGEVTAGERIKGIAIGAGGVAAAGRVGPGRSSASAGAGGRPPKIKKDVPLGTGPKNGRRLGRGLDDLMRDQAPQKPPIELPQNTPPRSGSRLGRGLVDLMQDVPPAREPASPLAPPNPQANLPRGLREPDAQELLDNPISTRNMPHRELRERMDRSGYDWQNSGRQHDLEALPVVAGVTGGVAALTGGAALSMYLNRNVESEPGVPPALAKARQEAAMQAAEAYQKDPNSRDFQIAMIRVQQIDSLIQDGPAQPGVPMPPSLKPNRPPLEQALMGNRR